MKYFPMKTGFLAVTMGIGLLSVTGAAQETPDIERNMKELKIMENIFEAALEEETGNGNRYRRVAPPRSMYLAGQGMVFSFQLTNSRRMSFFYTNGGNQGVQGFQLQDLQDKLALTEETLRKVEASFPDVDFDFNFDIDDDDHDRVASVRALPAAPATGAAPVVVWPAPPGNATNLNYSYNYLISSDAYEEERETIRDMQESMRETQQQIREQQREVRQLERNIRNASAGEAKNLQDRLDGLEEDLDADMEKYEEQQGAMETFMGDLEARRKELREAVGKEVSGQIIATLCDYGGSLRSLEDNEHVTIILQDVFDKTDQVYVFDYKDINDCRSAEDLMKKAIAYQM